MRKKKNKQSLNYSREAYLSGKEHDMFGTYSQKVAVLLIAIIGIIALGGCAQDKTVVITYQPLINAKSISGKPYPIPAGAGKMWMVYCISKIKNTGVDAVDFQFDLNRLEVGSGNQLVSPGWAWTAQSKLVNAGGTEFNVGRILIRADVTGMPYEGKYSWVPLLYDTTGEESVLIVQYPSPPTPDFKNGSIAPSNIPMCYDGALIPD